MARNLLWVGSLALAPLVLAAGTLAGGARPAPAAAGGTPAVDYNRDIRPILSENCFACHGPDAKERKGDLRLDTREGLFQRDGKVTPVLPGHPEQSEVMRRVLTDDADDVMPPRKTGKTLTARQKELLRRWVEQGAPWEGHWSFVAPKRAEPPAVKDAVWVRNPIDAFILARLEQEGLRPSPEANKETLIRRVTLDLTGLPPTPAEVDAFLLDNRPDAYERLVDRLLASPRYGERMALQWLDAARYADTHGYHIDSARDMTAWRKWVIDAYNANMPFDQFTVEQLAGDLLPGATTDQRIASGFNRNHMINFEGGAVPEEYHAAYLVDRVNTTGTVWLGLTVGCAQCHDHKYDPLTQKEYYQLYAFFNNVPEKGLDGKEGNAEPVLRLATPEQQQKLDEFAAQIADAERQLNDPSPAVDAAQAEWEQALAAGRKVEWAPLELAEATSAGGAVLAEQPDRSILASGTNPGKDTYTIRGRIGLTEVSALRLEALPHDSLSARGPGRSENGNVVLTDVKVTVCGGENPVARPVKVRAASADYSQKDFPVALAIDDKPQTGWAIYPEVGKAHEAVFEFEEPVKLGGGDVLEVTLAFQSPFGQHQFGCFRLSATDARHAAIPADLPPKVRAVLAVDAERRDEGRKAELRKYYRENVSAEMKQVALRLATLRKGRQLFERQIPTTMVMAEMAKPRDTFLLMRGEYHARGEQVTAGVPAFLPALSQETEANRLGLATWLVDPSNPLTTRVAVNRYWQTFFGTGIVKTAEDFGLQGELPSHPDLLDWLAVQFAGPALSERSESKRWDVKAMVKLLVTSSAYRQSSAVTPGLLEKDPENRLLARGPRHRLPAEFIRDQALAVSGLLRERIGGPSVSPYQPPGLWEELMYRSDGDNFSAQKYTQSKGDDLYRRTMYTFWKRTSPPPALATFDAPDREICTVRRAVTNTPLQALVLMNDPTYVEAARKLAERMMREGGDTPDGRIAFAFRLATAREPNVGERSVLREIFEAQLAEYRADKAAALKLLGVGESPRDESLDPAELAAWATVASTILNLDETITKG